MVFVYMTFKVVNYIPRKIDTMRQGNNSVKQNETQISKVANLEGKIKPLVDRWVADKRFCNANLSIKEVASQIGTNHNYLSQYLNNSLGTTFQLWLNTLRIEESKTILTSEDISIEEVGIRVGISESYNFSRWFKVVTGTTPFRYRRAGN
jgi:YesN/AraC family two-component response regulator